MGARRAVTLVAIAATAAACALSVGVTPPPGEADSPSTTRPASTTTTVAVTVTTIVTTTTTTSPPTTTTLAEDRTAFLRDIGANEAGAIMVLEYHLIETPEDRWSRTPAHFRQDIARLIAGGYYPITVRDLVEGRIDVPAGKTPVVLTFDDSSPGQCRYLDNGQVDPQSACGILLRAAEDHPGEWTPAASFYVLLDVDVPDRIVFGQPARTEQKLRDMVAWGMEIGSHTISHFQLDLGTADEIRWQLATPEQWIESVIPGYELDTLAVPFGIYPADESLLVSGEWEGATYDHIGVLEADGGPAASPHSAAFDPIHIPRIQAIQSELDAWLAYFDGNPTNRYVSDGDPTTVSVPESIDFTPAADLEGLTIVRYPG